MDIRTAHILVASLRTGDATSQHTFDLVRLLRRQGVATRIFHSDPNGDLPTDIAALTEHATYAGYVPSAELTIVQYALWFPLAERLCHAPGASLFWYHGVTPPALWGTEAGLDTIQISEVRTNLTWCAHLAVAASPFTAQELHQHTTYPAGRIRVVPLAVDAAVFAAPPDTARLAALRGQWQVVGKRVLLYIGRVAGNKRIDLLIQALARLLPEHPDLALLVVGDTASTPAQEYRTRLLALAAELGVGGQVTFTGRVPEVAPYLHLAELCVLPSQHEGFGVPVVEAMAAGVPALASASGALPWVMGKGDEAAGLTFAPGDAEDLARQIGRLLDDGALRAELVARGRARAAAFAPAVFEQNVLALLDEVMERSRQGPPPGDARHPLFLYTDVALRGYTVRSGAPVVGRLVEWVRRNSTSHVKEAYLDPIVERQVTYNQLLAAEVERLQAEVRRLREQVESLRRTPPA